MLSPKLVLGMESSEDRQPPAPKYNAEGHFKGPSGLIPDDKALEPPEQEGELPPQSLRASVPAVSGSRSKTDNTVCFYRARVIGLLMSKHSLVLFRGQQLWLGRLVLDVRPHS